MKTLDLDSSNGLEPMGGLPDGQMLQEAVVPTTPDEWEAQKDVIYDLYMVKNIRVQDVARIMASAYLFKATPRMYKQRFIKWQWQKYNRSRRGARKGASYAGLVIRERQASSSTSPSSDDTIHSASSHNTHSTYSRHSRHSTQSAHNSPHSVQSVALTKSRSPITPRTPQTPLTPPMNFINDDQFDIQLTLKAWEKYLWGWASDDRWRTGNKFECLKGDEQDKGWINQDFRGAIEQFNAGDAAGGGRLLRYGFMRLEDVLLIDHVNLMWTLCVQIPHMLHEAGYMDILVVFLRHIQNVSASRLPPNHPLGKAARAMQTLAERAPEQMGDYIQRACLLWVDTFAALRGRDDAVALSLRRAYLYMVTPTDELIDSYLSDCVKHAADAVETFGEDHLLPIGKEMEAMLTRWIYRRNVNHEMWDRIQLLVDRLYRLTDPAYAASPVPPPSPLRVGVPPPSLQGQGSGCAFARAYGLLAMIPLYLHEYDAAEKALRQFLVAERVDRNMWTAVSMEVESTYRKAGLIRQADEIRQSRINAQVPQRVVEILDREEEEMLEATKAQAQAKANQESSGEELAQRVVEVS